MIDLLKIASRNVKPTVLKSEVSIFNLKISLRTASATKMRLRHLGQEWGQQTTTKTQYSEDKVAETKEALYFGCNNKKS